MCLNTSFISVVNRCSTFVIFADVAHIIMRYIPYLSDFGVYIKLLISSLPTVIGVERTSITILKMDIPLIMPVYKSPCFLRGFIIYVMWIAFHFRFVKAFTCTVCVAFSKFDILQYAALWMQAGYQSSLKFPRLGTQTDLSLTYQMHVRENVTRMDRKNVDECKRCEQIVECTRKRKQCTWGFPFHYTITERRCCM